MSKPQITATAVRKAAKRLGDDHPAVIVWRQIASQRVAQINRQDADPASLLPGSGRVLENELEAAKLAVVRAAAI